MLLQASPRAPGGPAPASPQCGRGSLQLGAGGGLAQVREGPGRGHPAPGGALEEALLEQVGLVGVLDRVGLLPHAVGQGHEARPGGRRSDGTGRRGWRGRPCRGRARPPRRARGPRGRATAVMAPWARTSTKSRTRRRSRLAIRGVPRARDAMWRAPSSSTSTPRIPAERTTMPCEVVGRVQVEAPDEAEPVAQRAREQPRARGRPHQGEAGQVEPDRARRRPLADEDVELEVLHGRVQDLFDGARQAVDLVDEQHVAVLEVGEQARPGRRRAPAPGPEVMRSPTPISAATMPASDVLPRPGGPANSRWSTGCSRRRAASSTISRCSVSWGCPLNSSRCRGRRRASSASSAGSGSGFTGRAGLVGPGGAGEVRRVRGRRQHLAPAVHRAPASSRSAWRSSSSTVPSSWPLSRARRISSGP